MYAFRRWDEEKVIKGLAVLMCFAMVGLAVMPAVSPIYLWFECTYGHGPNLLNALELAESGAIATAAAYYSIIYATEIVAVAAGVAAAGIIIAPALLM